MTFYCDTRNHDDILVIVSHLFRSLIIETAIKVTLHIIICVYECEDKTVHLLVHKTTIRTLECSTMKIYSTKDIMNEYQVVTQKYTLYRPEFAFDKHDKT